MHFNPYMPFSFLILTFYDENFQIATTFSLLHQVIMHLASIIGFASSLSLFPWPLPFTDGWNILMEI